MPFKDRAADTEHYGDLFSCAHLEPGLQDIADAVRALAEFAVHTLDDGPELTAGLRKLLEARDCFVRQAYLDGQGDSGCE